jgi:hypothetical protein
VGVSYVDPAAEFLFRWKLTSTFHDVGYLFEVGGVDSDENTRSLSVLEAFRAHFVDDYISRTVGLTDPQRLTLSTRLNLLSHAASITKVDDLMAFNTGKGSRDAFEVIESSIRGKVRIPRGLVKNYLEMCSHKAAVRPARASFLDHGIMSALTLLRTVAIQNNYLNEIYDKAADGTLRDLAQEKVPGAERLLEHLTNHPRGDIADLGKFYARFAHVAAASALHNIYPGAFKLADCEEYRLDKVFCSPTSDPVHFGITLDDDPFAFLTALVDVLQDWDRHSFIAPLFDQSRKVPICGSEILIEVKKEKICLIPLTERAKKRYQTHVEELKETLVDYEKLVDTSAL